MILKKDFVIMLVCFIFMVTLHELTNSTEQRPTMGVFMPDGYENWHVAFIITTWFIWYGNLCKIVKGDSRYSRNVTLTKLIIFQSFLPLTTASHSLSETKVYIVQIPNKWMGTSQVND